MKESPIAAEVDSSGGAGNAGTETRGELVARAALSLAILVLLGPYLLLSGREIALADDAYYYLLPATNFWALGFYSFDGLTGTNGFHPLWMLLLTAMALPLHLAGAADGLPRAVLGLSVVLVVWGSLMWYGVLRRGGVSRALAALMVAVSVIAGQDLLLSGLETVAVFWSLALLAGYLIRQVQRAAPIQPGRLACYSLLVLFSRLDCGLLLLMLYGLLSFYTGPRRVIVAGVLLTLLATPYLLLNAVYHGAATPISGRVKQHWGDRYELETTGKTFGVSWAQIHEGPGRTRLRQMANTYWPRDIAPALKTLTLNRLDVTGSPKPWALRILAVALIAAGLRWAWALRSATPPPARFLVLFAGLLLLFYAASTLYYALSYDRVWPWYGAVGVMVMAAGLTFLAGGLLEYRPVKVLQGALLAALLVYWSASNVRDLRNAERNYATSLRSVYLDLADWLARNTPEDAVAGGWAVGEMGWYARRPVINLEGLAGNDALLEANKATDLLPFLAEYKITYLSNFWRPSLAPSPDALLAPTASDGTWKRDPVRYFWTLRLRPMMDCPEAFSVLHRHDAGDAQDTSGYVLGVDQETIARFLEARESWRAGIAACAAVVPAENLASIRGGKVEANIRRAEGYFVRGSDLVYPLEGLDAGNYEVYGRVCKLSSGEGSIQFAYGDTEKAASIPGQAQWRHVRLGSITKPDGEFRITAMSGEVYLDQLYLVSPEKRANFEALPADWWRTGQ